MEKLNEYNDEYNDELIMKGLSENPNVTMETFYENPHLNWDRKHLSKNPNFKKNNIQENNKKKNNLDLFEFGKNKSFEYVVSKMKSLKNKNENENENKIKSIMEGLSENPNVTMETYYANPTLKWSQEHLSKNPNICISDIQDYNKKYGNSWEFDPYLLSQNPNLTEELFLDGWPEIYSWSGYSQNKFTKHPNYTGHCSGMPSGEGFMK